MAGSRHKSRCAALQALYQWTLTQDPIVHIETQFKEERPMKGVNMPYFHHILHGVSTQATALDNKLAPLLDRPVHQLTPVEHNILRLAIYELCGEPKLPYKVVINEALELTKKYGSIDGFKYVNAVLDRWIKENGYHD